MIADINAGRLQVAPHAHGFSYGDLYWETQAGQPLNDTTWSQTVSGCTLWTRAVAPCSYTRRAQRCV